MQNDYTQYDHKIEINTHDHFADKIIFKKRKNESAGLYY